jgi:hypothetical protein
MLSRSSSIIGGRLVHVDVELPVSLVVKLGQLVGPIVDLGVAHKRDVDQVRIAFELVETVTPVGAGFGGALPERCVLLTPKGDELHTNAAERTATRRLIENLTTDAAVVSLS